MKMKASNSRKLRYGGVSAVLTVLVIVAVIIVNVIFSALSQRFLWYSDLTPELLFSLSDEMKSLISEGDETYEAPLAMIDKDREKNKAENPDFKDEDLMIKIIFCDDPDTLEGELIQKYVYNTALELQDEYPDYIKVENYNIIHNPSSVEKYKTNSMSTISTSSVIIDYGGEFQIKELRRFYIFDSTTSTQPWAYNGEKAYASSIMALTRAETPVACVTVNHGESISEDFLNTMEDAGYDTKELDLASDEIPENCRLLVVHNPLNDFSTADNGISDIDEIEKLKTFLEENGSLMVFLSPSLEVQDGQKYALPELEDFLAEWGIKFDRYSDPSESGKNYSYKIKESSINSYTIDGYTFRAQYVTSGPAADITKEMRERYVAPIIVFPNAMSISYADGYEPTHYDPEDDENAAENATEYDYGAYGKNGTYRNIYDLFTTSNEATAWANGRQVATATASPFKLMTITREQRYIDAPDGSYVTDPTYVVACGCVEFGSTGAIQSTAYGNTDLLLSVFRTLSKEPVPVGLTYKAFSDDTIDIITTGEATRYTVILTVIPAVLSLGAGIFVIVRRKYR